MTRVLFLAVLGAFAPGCENQGEIAQPGARPAVSPRALDAGLVVKRTVEQRSPFGNTSYPANLLADGDFEFTGRNEQMPWIVFGSTGQQTLNYDTGGLCHSGIRCALIAPGDALIGYVSSPKKSTMDVSLWISPVSDGHGASLACKFVQVSMTDLSNQGTRTDIHSETEDPIDGWCHFTGSTPNLAGGAPVIYVDFAKGAKASARVDDGVVKPAAGGAAGRLPLLRTVPAAESTRVAFIAEYLRTHRRYGVPSPHLEY
jgi:hypothetical protein